MRGIITVLNTPFTADDGLDLPGLRTNVQSAIDAGVAGFLVPALASEVDALTEDERITLISTVVETSAGRVPVIGGASAATQEARLRFAREASDLGCAGVLVNMPLKDELTFEQDLSEIGELEPGFIMLQDWDPVGEGLPIPFVTRLFERIPAFTWLKIEVIPAGPKYSAVLEATEGRLQVAGGWAVMQMIEALDRGAHAFMPTGMHRIYTEIYARYTSGDREKALELFERVLPVLAFSNQRLDISIAFFKRLLNAQGVFATSHCRAPVKELDANQTRVADELITRAIAIEAELARTA